MRIAILVLLLVVGKVVCAQPFTMNGWQFHECNVPKLAEAVRKAPEYGVNFFIFSHERQRDVLHIGSLADQQKIPWYLWAHEFDDIPERFMVRNEIRPDDPRMSAAALSSSFRLGSRVNMDDPALLDYLRERYERLLAKCHTAAGLVLTFHESDRKLFRDSEVMSKLSVPDRIHLLSRLVCDVVKKHNRKLIIRNFFYEPREMDYFAQAIARLPDDIIFMSKEEDARILEQTMRLMEVEKN
ncbi:MAG TPA: hypothetical protein VFD58_15715 [Blastocatellia bacterium]|nr:hypothetical protein [Blastocatellia bacterium]